MAFVFRYGGAGRGPDDAVGVRISSQKHVLPADTAGRVDIAREGCVPPEIRRRYPALPIVLTTGYVEAAADARDQGFGLLLKPFSIEALAEALGVPSEPAKSPM